MSDDQLRADLVLNDSFHRTKRTALVFFTATLVTILPGIEVTESAGLLGISFKAVPMDLIRSLLWATGLYYAIGFVAEFFAAYRANSELLSNKAVGHVDRAAEEYCQALRVASKELQTVPLSIQFLTSETFQDHTRAMIHFADPKNFLANTSWPPHPTPWDFVEQIKTLISASSSFHTPQTLKLSKSTINKIGETIGQQLRTGFEGTWVHQSRTIAEHVTRLERILEVYNGNMETLRRMVHAAEDSLPERHRSAWGPVRRIGISRSFLFFGWNLAGLVLVFAASTALAIVPALIRLVR